MALLDIRGHIEFIYFDDLHAACDFFGNVLGLPLVGARSTAHLPPPIWGRWTAVRAPARRPPAMAF